MSDGNQGGAFACARMCWIAGGLFGLATGLVLAGYGVNAILSILAGLVVMGVIGWLLMRLFCQNIIQTRPSAAPYTNLDVAASPEAVAGVDLATDSSLAMPPRVPEVGREVHPGEGIEAVKEAEELAAAEAKATPKATPEATPKATPEAAPSGAGGGKPEMLAQARESGADDLKQIKGVGPKLEALLNSMGIYHFDQIAAWAPEQVAWMDDNLQGFKGRVSRDKWVEQAITLAAGGETEFSNRVKKGKVYKS